MLEPRLRVLYLSLASISFLSVLEVLAMAHYSQWLQPRVWLMQAIFVVVMSLLVSAATWLVLFLRHLVGRTRPLAPQLVATIVLGVAFVLWSRAELPRLISRPIPGAITLLLALLATAACVAVVSIRAPHPRRSIDLLLPTVAIAAGLILYGAAVRAANWWQISMPIPPLLLLLTYVAIVFWVTGWGDRGRSRLALVMWPLCGLIVLRLLLPSESAARELPGPSAVPIATSPPVLFIVLDTFRADAIDLSEPATSRTPNLARFAYQSDVYLHAVANASWTLPGHASLFSGLQLHQHRTDMNRQEGYSPRLASSLDTAPQVFADHGYDTSAVAANPVLAPGSGLLRGFHYFRNPGRIWITNLQSFRLARLATRGVPPELLFQVILDLIGLNRDATAEEIVDQALRRLDDTPGRDFLFLNFMETHRPRQPGGATPTLASPRRLRRDLLLIVGWMLPGGLDGLMSDQEQDQGREEFRLEYAEQVDILDLELGRLFDGLRERNLFDPALIVLTSDHGEAFWENSELAHYGGHGGAYEPVVRIPLLIKRPGQREARWIEQPVQQSDVLPEMLRITGLAEDSSGDLSRGSRLPVLTEWYPKGGGIVHLPWSRVAVYRGEYKFVIEEGRGEHLYDLAASPFEEVDVVDQFPEDADEMRQVLEDILSQTPAADALEEPDEGLLEALKALGYID